MFSGQYSNNQRAISECGDQSQQKVKKKQQRVQEHHIGEQRDKRERLGELRCWVFCLFFCFWQLQKFSQRHRIPPLLHQSTLGLSSSNLLQTASEKEVVGVGRHELVARWQHREAEKHESANDVGPISPLFRQGQYDVTALQLLLGVLQQSHKSLFGAGLDETRRDLQIETSSPQNTFPAPVASGRQFQNKGQTSWLLSRRFDQFLSLDRVIKISFPIYLIQFF